MRKFISPLLFLLLIFIVFRSWFLPGTLSTFDFPYFSRIMMGNANLIPYTWGFHVGLDGFSRFLSPYSWVFPIIYVPQIIFGNWLGMDWSQITRIVYFYPFLILCVASPIFLFRYLFPKNNFYLFAAGIYLFNTYALMLAGGEVFLALAYALAPTILLIFIKQISENREQKAKIKYGIVAGLLVTLQIMFDPRIAYVTLFAVAIYLLFVIYNLLFSKKILNTFYLMLYVAVIPLGITVLLQMFWILPTVIHWSSPVGQLGLSHSSIEAVRYFSFAKFENTISLLHPNWPENIFGKVNFMKPEFLLLPILAFVSLLFVRKQTTESRKQNFYVLFFALIGLVGAFLAKGSNGPFGEVYLWLFKYFPGFELFRDATKFYLLIAISYSILIPFNISKIYELLKSKRQFLIFNLQNIFLILATLYLLLLIRPAILGQLNGMFKTTTVPQDYVRLEKFLSTQPGYFRTLWFPVKQRFSYYSNSHPIISATALFDLYDEKSLFSKLSENETERALKDASVKYVIVPDDSEKEIFLTDRKYDNRLYLRAVNNLQKINWLKEIRTFGKITVFGLDGFRDHFWSSDPNLEINYKYISPVKYSINVKNAKKGNKIIFTEKFDKNWTAKVLGNKYQIISIDYDRGFNSFVLPESGNYTLKVSYTIQNYVNIGLVVSLTSLMFCLGSFFTKNRRFQ